MRANYKVLAVSAALAFSAGMMPLAAVQAQDYPSQNIHLISAFPPGSGADIVVRYYSEKLKPLIKQNVIVESKVGAGGTLAVEYIARAKPDGHTILVHSGITAANMMYLLKKPPIDAAKDLQLAAMINRQPFMVVVRADAPWKDLAQLTGHLKQQKDKSSYGWAATIAKVAGELYKNKSGLQTVDVAYRAGPDLLNDLLGGVIDFAVLDPALAMAQLRQGKIRILAVTTQERIKASADLPTMEEQGVKDINLVGWFGAILPSATPRPIVDQINVWFNAITSSPETKEFLAKTGADPWITSVDEAQSAYLKEVQAWGDYVRLAKIDPQ